MTRSHALFVLVLGLLGISCSQMSAAHAQEPAAAALPLHYHALAKVPRLKLLAVMGHPEAEPAYGHSMVFSKDLRVALVATGRFGWYGERAALTLWDIVAGKVLREWAMAKGSFTAVAISQDGRVGLTAFVSADNKQFTPVSQLIIWDLAGGKRRHTIDGLKPLIMSLAISPDGKRGLFGGRDGELQLWDLVEGREIKTLQRRNEMGLGIHGIAFTPDGASALANGGPGEFVNQLTMKLWNLSTGAARTLPGGASSAYTIALSKDGLRAVAGGHYGDIDVWDLKVGRLAKYFRINTPHKDTPFATATMSEDGKRILTLGTVVEFDDAPVESFLSLWNAETGEELWTAKGRFQTFAPVAILPDGQHALLGGGADPFTKVRLSDGKTVKQWGGHKAAVRVVVADGQGRVYSGAEDGTFKVWGADGIELTNLNAHAGAIHALALMEGGKLLLTGGEDNNIKLWHVATGQAVKTLSGHSGAVTGLAVAADGKLAVSGSADRTVRLWDIAAGSALKTLTGHGERVNAVAVESQGAWIASGSDDNTVRLWPLASNRDVGQVRVLGHRRPVTALAFAADGRHVFSASEDHAVRQWEVATGTEVRSFAGHKNRVTSLAVRGDRLLTGSEDLTVRLWDVTSGKEIAALDLGQCGDWPRSVAFAPTGDSFLVGTAGWLVLRFEEKK